MNMGYAINHGIGQCPTELDLSWEFWDWEVEQWISDPEAFIRCQGAGPTDPPTSPPIQGDCCDTVKLDSEGSLASSGQAHIIGLYYKHSDGPEGSVIYKGERLYMYFYPQLDVSALYCIYIPV